jgi:ketosteroid isomerase-like protein
MSNLELARALYDAFGRGDVPTVLAAMDPAIDWREAEGNPYQMDGSSWKGPQAIVDKLFAPLGNDWDGFTVKVQSLHDAGDRVVMEGRYTGRSRATGKALDAQACHVLRFSNGKLVGFQQYCDTAQLQAVMGKSA